MPLNISKSTYDRERGGRGRAGGGGGGDRWRERERERKKKEGEGKREGWRVVCVLSVFVCIRNGNSHTDSVKNLNPRSLSLLPKT